MASYWWVIGLIIVGVIILILLPYCTSKRVVGALSVAGILIAAFAFIQTA